MQHDVLQIEVDLGLLSKGPRARREALEVLVAALAHYRSTDAREEMGILTQPTLSRLL